MDNTGFAIVVQAIVRDMDRAQQQIDKLTAEDADMYRCLIREYEGQIIGGRRALSAICGVVAPRTYVPGSSPVTEVIEWAKAVWPEGKWA